MLTLLTSRINSLPDIVRQGPVGRILVLFLGLHVFFTRGVLEEFVVFLAFRHYWGQAGW